MAEIGFSLFFMVALVAAILALGRTISRSWERIAAALDGRLIVGPAPERILSIRTCAPIDLPYVAHRLYRVAALTARLPLSRRKAA
jgi:hypothetical protein